MRLHVAITLITSSKSTKCLRTSNSSEQAAAAYQVLRTFKLSAQTTKRTTQA
jgi:hypothetical protein